MQSTSRSGSADIIMYFQLLAVGLTPILGRDPYIDQIKQIDPDYTLQIYYEN